MQALVVRRTRRRSRRRNFRLFKDRVAERLVAYADPNIVGNTIVQYDFALKRMHRARVSVPSAAVMVRRQCLEGGPKENPTGTQLSRGAMWLGASALVALGIAVIATGVKAYAKKQDDTPFMYDPPLVIDV